MPSFPGSEIVVADASPFIHLDRAGCLRVLPALFRVVRVPETVAAEIAAGRNRGLVIPDIASLTWVHVEADRDDPAVRLLPGLDAGEIAALSVARAIAADLVSTVRSVEPLIVRCPGSVIGVTAPSGSVRASEM